MKKIPKRPFSKAKNKNHLKQNQARELRGPGHLNETPSLINEFILRDARRRRSGSWA